jgi:hypothetical protein
MREKKKDDPKAILERLEAQSEKTLGTSPPEDNGDDWTGRWGKRLGLIFGYGLALFLLWHLYTTYVAG